MSNSDLLLQYKERLANYLLAEVKVQKAGQSYAIGNRNLTRGDLQEIRDAIEDLNKKIAKLGRGGGIRVQRPVYRDI